jgi:7-carboxy-7-deazaguanine synthase
LARSYAIKEIFLTLQGEGARTGAKSLFVRFAGCNLWSGEPSHRAQGRGPCARWCDTDFIHGTKIELDDLCARMHAAWPSSAREQRWCVLTGGEPGLQIDPELVDALHRERWSIAVETNGTIDSDALRRCDHVCLSPKRGTEWHSLAVAHEVKVILPGAVAGEQGWTDEELEALETRALALDPGPELFVQPQDPIAGEAVLEQTLLKHDRGAAPPHLDGLRAAYQQHLERCIAWVMKHPRWRLSAQMHKYIGVA